MKSKKQFTKLATVLSATFVFAIAAAFLWQRNADAQSKKQFKGARVENNQLIPESGHKLRQASNSLIEVIKEETTTTGSGPTSKVHLEFNFKDVEVLDTQVIALAKPLPPFQVPAAGTDN